jgi:hypothetical protein
MQQQNLDSTLRSVRGRAPPRGDEGIRGLAGHVRSVAESMRREGAEVARAMARVSEDLTSLVKYAGSARAPRLVRDAERLARRQPALFLGGAFLLGLAILRILRNSPPRGADEAAMPPSAAPLDESRRPRHDGPSGYFSARGEGTITNTPQTRTVR